MNDELEKTRKQQWPNLQRYTGFYIETDEAQKTKIILVQDLKH
jgi:hypothetical protein